MSNSADKRTPHTDALETLGTIHTQDEFRDAIHLAVEQVVAGEDLRVGEHITYVNGKAFSLRKGEESIGIVDPFLDRMVKEGERFWLVVKPRLITSLRHVWSHPAFPDEASVLFLKQQQAGSGEADVPKELLAQSPEKLAYAWIVDYAASLSEDDSESNNYDGTVTAEELIKYGWAFYESNRKGSWGDYLCKGGLLEGVGVAEEFWDNLAILKGVAIEQEHRESFFTCSC